jgi:ketosteroid isomerase-like protein
MLLVLAAAFAEPTAPPPVDAPPAEPAPAAAPMPSEEQLHDELRALRAKLIGALESRDLDALEATLDENVVFTATSGEVARGRKGVRAYAEKMLSGEEALVTSFRYDASSDELSVFYNGARTAIAWGPSRDSYTFGDGSSITLDTRWSATLVRDDAGGWHIVSFHSSLHAFDNAILEQVKGYLPLAGGAGLGAGVLVGALAGFLLGRRR